MSIADISLLNQDRLILICIASSALMTLLLVKQPKRWYMTRFPYLIGGSMLIGFIVWVLLWHTYPEDGVPPKLVLWVAISLFSISTLFTLKRHRQQLIIGSFGTFFTVLLSLMLANNYFQYYPTIGSMFGSASTSQSAVNGSVVETTRHIITPPPSVEASYTQPSDQPAQGTLTSILIPGPASNFAARQSFVYLPPAELSSKPPALPVLVLFSGVPGNPGDWKDRLSVLSTLDAFAAKHKGLAPIVVIADQTGGDGFTSTGCVDSSRGNSESYITKDIPAYIKSHYNVTAAPQGWAIGGISDGGACSTVIAARHPDLFSAFMSLSGETSPSIESKQNAVNSLFNGSLAKFNAYDTLLLFNSKNASNTYARTAGWLAIGRDEQQPLVQDNRALFDEAQHNSIDMTLETLPGHHGFGLWTRSFIDALPWVSQRTGATQ